MDEYRLITRPLALGSGEPMFKGLSAQRRLELAEVTGYPDGTASRSTGGRGQISTSVTNRSNDDTGWVYMTSLKRDAPAP